MASAAYHRIKEWMKTHAPEVLEQLRAPATNEDIATAEQALGFALPESLKSLLRENDGSDDECGFFGSLQFVPTDFLQGAREDVMMWVGYDRKYSAESPDLFPEVYPELASDEWLAIGHQGYADQLALHARTERVFTAEKDIPALKLVAPSLEAYLEAYALDLANGLYSLEEGFGGMYLERND
ncbi:MAG: SMI1/KNR4 family protein [Polyangiaceae bacterium]